MSYSFMVTGTSPTLVWGALALFATFAQAAEPKVDFTRDVKPILSNRCFHCHGPDDAERQGGVSGLRLDTHEGALADLGNGTQAIVPGQPDASVLVERIATDDEFTRMPPVESGAKLTEREIRTLKTWIAQGADYAPHWSYVSPDRPPIPKVSDTSWIKTPIDSFILARLKNEGLSPSPEADRWSLARRVALDLTGLPPTRAEALAFVEDESPDAYERYVDRLLAKPAFGEHWARMWLDLARYADSAGYADDPPREIWAYRDWVIRAFNRNQPFDEFTIDQIAGDLLPNPTEDQLIATAFHRNTQTNNEGGTNDEEFRTVAVVDRVNTTFATWMGTTMACAQCHTHKYDPITQTEYFGAYAVFNTTADADRRDESPTLSFLSPEQSRQQEEWQSEIDFLKGKLSTLTLTLAQGLDRWDRRFPRDLDWQTRSPSRATTTSGGQATTNAEGIVSVQSTAEKDTYRVALPLPAGALSALRIEALTDKSLPSSGPGLAGNGNFVVTAVRAKIVPQSGMSPVGRVIRIDLPGNDKMLSLAEVQVFSGGENIARTGTATQSSTAYDGPAELAIDGITNGDYTAGKSVTHTATTKNPWWQVDLGRDAPIDRIVIWNRTDGNLESRLAGYRVSLRNAANETIWETTPADVPKPSSELITDGGRTLEFSLAVANRNQPGFEAENLVKPANQKPTGWAIGGGGQEAAVMLALKQAIDVQQPSVLELEIEQSSPHARHLLGRFRISTTDSDGVVEWLATPADVVSAIQRPMDERSDDERQRLTEYYLTNLAPELADERKQLADLEKKLADLKKVTVPIMRELPGGKARVTKLQYRGNYLDEGPVVEPHLPAVFPGLPEEKPVDRLALAHWLVSRENPLTARVSVNRYWEKLFGIGLVSTSEDFGSQGELPSHPELLDWLAVEYMESGWDTKHMLRLMVTSAAYRQSSAMRPEDEQRDPANRLVARGPRFRMTAEAVRDQALQVSGLLSEKLYGPPVRPPQPSFGLSAAFGGGIDWKTSEGEDRYRRAIYTTWRRSNPYPSMATFDAPNREVCIVRRDRTNTPLQALVTLNDPVYVEAAQALARRMVREGGASLEERVRFGLEACLVRPATDAEVARLAALHTTLVERLGNDKEKAKRLATDPLGPLEAGQDPVEMAAWTVVGNVMLNLDEMFMSR